MYIVIYDGEDQLGKVELFKLFENYDTFREWMFDNHEIVKRTFQCKPITAKVELVTSFQ